MLFGETLFGETSLVPFRGNVVWGTGIRGTDIVSFLLAVQRPPFSSKTVQAVKHDWIKTAFTYIIWHSKSFMFTAFSYSLVTRRFLMVTFFKSGTNSIETSWLGIRFFLCRFSNPSCNIVKSLYVVVSLSQS
jgi:hypothetical protein